MTTQQTYIIRPVESTDRNAWDLLYQGYAQHYKVEQTSQMRDQVWSWLQDTAAESEGLVAQSHDGAVVGLAHFRPFARPLTASVGCFLDDLFVSPEQRGLGAAQALIDGVKSVARERGWTVVRWITADDNYRARGVYDQVATQTQWVTYDISL